MIDTGNKTNISLTSGRLLARNTLLNVLGSIAPLLVAFFSIPLIIREFGIERYGVLTIAWIFIGYFSLFDLGLGRALTKMVAKSLGDGQEEKIPAIIWTSMFLMLVLSIIGALVMSMLSPFLIYNVINVPTELQSEVLQTFFLLAGAIPIIISTSGFRGVLAAKQRFGFINAVRISMGIFTFASPLLVLPFSKSIFIVVAVMTAARLLILFIYLIYCLYIVPELRRGIIIQREAVVPLLRFGSWMTVSNIIGPMMVYMDRLFIGALISVTAVAYYTTPYDLITRLLLVSGAMVEVLFPAFATSCVHDRSRTVLLFERAVKYVFIAIFPITLLSVSFAYEGINFWLGAMFAQKSSRILQWLAIGVFINSFAKIPFVLIQGAGRPDLTSKLHLIELPFYLGSVYWLTITYGIEGTAIAWVGRIVVDTVFLFAMANRILPNSISSIRHISLTVAIALPTLFIASLPMGIAVKGLFLMIITLVFAVTVWFLLLDSEERLFLQYRFKLNRIFTEK